MYYFYSYFLKLPTTIPGIVDEPLFEMHSDPPAFGIQVIEAISQVFYIPQGYSLMPQNIVTRRIGGNGKGFASQVHQRFMVGAFDATYFHRKH